MTAPSVNTIHKAFPIGSYTVEFSEYNSPLDDGAAVFIKSVRTGLEACITQPEPLCDICWDEVIRPVESWRHRNLATDSDHMPVVEKRLGWYVYVFNPEARQSVLDSVSGNLNDAIKKARRWLTGPNNYNTRYFWD